MQSLDLLIPTAIFLSGSLLYCYLHRYSSSDEIRLKTELDGVQIHITLFSSKVAIVEQYIEDFWHTIPSDEQEDLEILFVIRARLERVMEAARVALKERRHADAWDLVQKLSGKNITVGSDLDCANINNWEERSHKLILRICQKLTIEASLSTKHVAAEKYKRQPSLLSLREISELLREERSLRL